MKKLSNLKALLLSFMLVACFVLPMKAQKSDGFFRNNELYNDRTNGIGIGGASLEYPTLDPLNPGFGMGGATEEDPTPIGSGLVILLAAGAGYALRNRLKITDKR